MEYLGLAARFVLAAVFLVAGAGKLTDPDAVRAAVANYRLLPAAWVRPVARTLPWAEVALGALLAAGVLVSVSALVAAAFLLGFAAAVEINLRRGRSIGCGCGLRRQQRISRRLILRNLVLATGAAVAAIAPSAALAVWPGPGTADSILTHDEGFAIAVAVTALLALGVLALEVLDFQVARGRLRRRMGLR